MSLLIGPDPTAPLYFFTALLLIGIGGGVALYERFTLPSWRFLVLTLIAATWLGALGAAAAAEDPETVVWWLRVAFMADPFTAPAMYALAAALAGVRRPRLERGLVLTAAAFALLSVAGPWLVLGLEQATRDLSLAGHGWLGALYFLYVVSTVGIAVAELLRSEAIVRTRDHVVETRLLAATGMLVSLTLLDYWLPNDPYRVGLLTPIAIAIGAVLASLAAIRYRTFAILHSYGTEEVLRAIDDVVLVCDTDCTIRSCNESAERLLDRTERGLLGLAISEFFALTPTGGTPWLPRPESAIREQRLYLLPGGRSGGAAAAGKPVPVSISTEPMIRAGRVVGLVVVARDLREQLRANRGMEEAERRFRALFEYNPGIVYEIAADGSMLALNRAGVDLLGEPSEDVVGRPFVELIEPDDRPDALAVYQKVLSGNPEVYELGIRRRDGDRRRIRGVSVPVVEGTDVVSILGVALDVTEESRAKQRLEVQRRYYAELFEASPEAVALVGADGRVRRVNGEFVRLFGYSREEVAGRLLDDLIVPPELEAEGKDLTRQALTGGLARAETVRHRKEGGLVDVSLLAREVRIPGEPPQMYAIYRDVTDRRAAEQRLRDREEELRHAQKLEAVGKLAGGIAHDFNNLLTVINGHARFLLDQPGAAEPFRGDLEEIEKAGSRAATLTQQLLAFSRRQVLRPQVIDLNTVIADFQRMLGRLIGEHIHLHTDLRAADARVRADRGQLEQVVMNLVVNARDAMPQGGELTVATRMEYLASDAPDVTRWDLTAGPYVRLDVTDTGHGIPPDTLEHIFDPFFTTKERGKGTGLGLSTVFGIVKQTGGHVTAESEMGEGATFRVLLPLAAEAVEEPAPPPEPQPRDGAGEARTILVVEDEAAVRKLAARVLERAGHVVLQSTNGAEALELLQTRGGEVQLVLTDLVMPVMGGRDLRTALGERYPGLPVVFMSGYDEEQALDGGQRDAGFLAKPFTPAALVTVIQKALEGTSYQPAPR